MWQSDHDHACKINLPLSPLRHRLKLGLFMTQGYALIAPGLPMDPEDLVMRNEKQHNMVALKTSNSFNGTGPVRVNGG